MLCLDSYVLMDLLSDKHDRIAKAKKYVSDVESKGGIISVAALTEVFFCISRRSTSEDASKALSFIKSIERLGIAGVTEDIAILAGKLRKKYYKNKEREISYLDCIHLATAIMTNCKKFVTGDKDFEDIEEIDIEVY